MARKLIADVIPQKSSQPATQSAPAPKFATKFKGLLGKNLVVADVGCRWGFAEFWQQISPHVILYGFDPDPDECERLRTLYKDPNIHLVPLGLAEAVDPSSRVHTHSKWEPHLLASGYRFVYFDAVNRFYLASEHGDLAEHFVLPPNVFDDFTVARFGGYPVYAPQAAAPSQKPFLQRVWESVRNVGRSHTPSSR